jgi:cupin superfamily acireductone dioxygenase involved in methionine salvage
MCQAVYYKRRKPGLRKRGEIRYSLPGIPYFAVDIQGAYSLYLTCQKGDLQGNEVQIIFS